MQCKSILVVEDQSDIREAMTDTLQTEGYDVYSASSGEQALELIGEIPYPPLILLDMMMPRTNGWEFLEMRKKDPKLADLPVVLVTAVNESDALVPRSGEVKAEGHLSKPIDVDSLLKVVSTYCNPSA